MGTFFKTCGKPSIIEVRSDKFFLSFFMLVGSRRPAKTRSNGRKGSAVGFNCCSVTKSDYVQTVTHRIPRRLVSCHESWQEKGKYFPGPQ
jgi:hypothetical protein